MTKTLIKAIIISTVLLLQPKGAESQPAKKLGRGVINIATAPLEVPKQARIYWKEGAKKTDHILVWIFSGIVKGGANTAGRLGSGLWDVVTFPFNIPKDKKALFQPEYVFSDYQELF